MMIVLEPASDLGGRLYQAAEGIRCCVPEQRPGKCWLPPLCISVVFEVVFECLRD